MQQISRDPAYARELAAGPAGRVRLELWTRPASRLVISGPGVPLVMVDRVQTGADRDKREPTVASVRDGELMPRGREAVSLTVAGTTAQLAPRRVVMIRAGYGARASVGERRYLLSQLWWRSARVRRDGHTVARLRRPVSPSEPGEYEVRWRDADPLDVSMTHALATSYRVGSHGLILNLLKVVYVIGSLFGN